jgi:hypothetical protein
MTLLHAQRGAPGHIAVPAPEAVAARCHAAKIAWVQGKLQEKGARPMLIYASSDQNIQVLQEELKGAIDSGKVAVLLSGVEPVAPNSAWESAVKAVDGTPMTVLWVCPETWDQMQARLAEVATRGSHTAYTLTAHACDRKWSAERVKLDRLLTTNSAGTPPQAGPPPAAGVVELAALLAAKERQAFVSAGVDELALLDPYCFPDNPAWLERGGVRFISSGGRYVFINASDDEDHPIKTVSHSPDILLEIAHSRIWPSSSPAACSVIQRLQAWQKAKAELQDELQALAPKAPIAPNNAAPGACVVSHSLSIAPATAATAAYNPKLLQAHRRALFYGRMAVLRLREQADRRVAQLL